MAPTQSIILAMALPAALLAWLVRSRPAFVCGLIGAWFGLSCTSLVRNAPFEEAILWHMYHCLYGAAPGAVVGTITGSLAFRQWSRPRIEDRHDTPPERSAGRHLP